MEATFICIDNSEVLRNGDFKPSRYHAQVFAINLLVDVKTRSNPEAIFGIMSIGGVIPKVWASLTTDLEKLLDGLNKIRIQGALNLARGAQIAQLALKHRRHKTQRQRIVIFIGSPIFENQKDLVKIGKNLKKNNVAVDVVDFASLADNTAKMQAFVEAVNSNNNSHLVTVMPGGLTLTDCLIATPIYLDDFFAESSEATRDDPTDDTEFVSAVPTSVTAQALRLSVGENNTTLEERFQEYQEFDGLGRNSDRCEVLDPTTCNMFREELMETIDRELQLAIHMSTVTQAAVDKGRKRDDSHEKES
jgi:26S proteasome regulatory subunit N10